MPGKPRYLNVSLGRYLDEAARRSPRSARLLWLLIVGLALLAIFLTGAV